MGFLSGIQIVLNLEVFSEIEGIELFGSFDVKELGLGTMVGIQW